MIFGLLGKVEPFPVFSLGFDINDIFLQQENQAIFWQEVKVFVFIIQDF